MAFDLSIATYNIFMRPEGIIFNDGQKKRLPLMLPRILDLEADVLILNEAFDDGLRKKIVQGLAAEFPHRTKVVGKDRGLRQDGGVILLRCRPPWAAATCSALIWIRAPRAKPYVVSR